MSLLSVETRSASLTNVREVPECRDVAGAITVERALFDALFGDSPLDPTKAQAVSEAWETARIVKSRSVILARSAAIDSRPEDAIRTGILLGVLKPMSVDREESPEDTNPVERAANDRWGAQLVRDAGITHTDLVNDWDWAIQDTTGFTPDQIPIVGRALRHYVDQSVDPFAVMEAAVAWRHLLQ